MNKNKKKYFIQACLEAKFKNYFIVIDCKMLWQTKKKNWFNRI